MVGRRVRDVVRRRVGDVVGRRVGDGWEVVYHWQWTYKSLKSCEEYGSSSGNADFYNFTYVIIKVWGSCLLSINCTQHASKFRLAWQPTVTQTIGVHEAPQCHVVVIAPHVIHIRWSTSTYVCMYFTIHSTTNEQVNDDVEGTDIGQTPWAGGSGSGGSGSGRRNEHCSTCWKERLFARASVLSQF